MWINPRSVLKIKWDVRRYFPLIAFLTYGYLFVEYLFSLITATPNIPEKSTPIGWMFWVPPSCPTLPDIDSRTSVSDYITHILFFDPLRNHDIADPALHYALCYILLLMLICLAIIVLRVLTRLVEKEAFEFICALTGLCIAIACALGIIKANLPNSEFIRQLPVLVGIIIAAIGWLYTTLQQRRIQIRQHTFDFIESHTGNSEFIRHRDVILGRFPKGVDLNDKDIIALDIESNGNASPAIGAPLTSTNTTPSLPTLLSITLFLDFYENFSYALRKECIDEEISFNSMRSSIVRAGNKFRLYIDARRFPKNGAKDTFVYEHLVWLHNRWNPKSPLK